MLFPLRKAQAFVLAGTVFAASVALADPPLEEPIKNRTAFIPNRKHQPLKGTVIGVLLYDGQPILSAEGRSGPGDQLCFSTAGGSYRWVYVPVNDPRPQISNLKVPVGDKGDFMVYPSLDIARPKNVTAWNIKGHYTLVEVTVNNGLGSPANDSFVATHLKVLDGTEKYPLKTADVIAELKQKYADHLQEQSKQIDAAVSEAQQKALKDKKPTGPREKSELMYVTWLPENERLVVHFRSKISDGAYTIENRGGIRPIDPPKAKGKIKQPPPPPRDFRVKIGTTFGIEFGMAYEVSKTGKLIRRQPLAIESFQQQVNQTMIGDGRDIIPPPKR